MVEKQLVWLRKLKGMRWIVLRNFNAAGADPDGEICEVHGPETHLIPLALLVATLGDFTLQVFGSEYATPDGTATRDYINVHDLATTRVLALDAPRDVAVNNVFNLGTGQGTSVRKIITAAENTTGVKVQHHFAPRRQEWPFGIGGLHLQRKCKTGMAGVT